MATVEATTVVMVAHGEVKPDDGVWNGWEALGGGSDNLVIGGCDRMMAAIGDPVTTATVAYHAISGIRIC